MGSPGIHIEVHMMSFDMLFADLCFHGNQHLFDRYIHAFELFVRNRRLHRMYSIRPTLENLGIRLVCMRVALMLLQDIVQHVNILVNMLLNLLRMFVSNVKLVPIPTINNFRYYTLVVQHRLLDNQVHQVLQCILVHEFYFRHHKHFHHQYSLTMAANLPIVRKTGRYRNQILPFYPDKSFQFLLGINKRGYECVDHQNRILNSRSKGSTLPNMHYHMSSFQHLVQDIGLEDYIVGDVDVVQLRMWKNIGSTVANVPILGKVVIYMVVTTCHFRDSLQIYQVVQHRVLGYQYNCGIFGWFLTHMKHYTDPTAPTVTNFRMVFGYIV